MSEINDIQKSVQEVVEAVNAILGVDVTVINTELERIAATGKYKDSIGKKLPSGCYYDEVLNNKNSDTIIQRLHNNDCINCESLSTCEEIATIGYPIFTKDKKILGVMGLIAFKEEQRNFINNNFNEISIFLNKLGDLLAGNIDYERTINDLFLKNKEMKNLINSLDSGIILTNKNLVIENINNKTLKLLKTSSDKLYNKNINEIFENIQFKGSSPSKIYPIKSKINNSNEEYIIKVLPNEINNVIQSYLFEISKYSKMLQNAYEIMEQKEEVNFADILGESFKIKNTISLAKQVSMGDSSIMIRGESGTGKELFARAIHNNSSRKNNMFIAINCASIPDHLLESELFGYEKGAFTDANTSGKIGRFELANGGTLFLDEIGDLPIHLQPKLLRVLQDNSFTRLGGNKKINVDFRLITATNKNLEKMITNNEFREDLYYRLNVIPINIPSLKERKEDITTIANEKLKLYCEKLNKAPKKFTPDLLNKFKEYEWNGNIRELENIIEYLVNLSEEEYITSNLLPSSFNKDNIVNLNKTNVENDLIIDEYSSLKNLTEQFEKQILEEYIKKFGNSTINKKQIAEILDINLSTLYRKLYRYGIN